MMYHHYKNRFHALYRQPASYLGADLLATRRYFTFQAVKPRAARYGLARSVANMLDGERRWPASSIFGADKSRPKSPCAAFAADP